MPKTPLNFNNLIEKDLSTLFLGFTVTFKIMVTLPCSTHANPPLSVFFDVKDARLSKLVEVIT